MSPINQLASDLKPFGTVTRTPDRLNFASAHSLIDSFTLQIATGTFTEIAYVRAQIRNAKAA